MREWALWRVWDLLVAWYRGHITGLELVENVEVTVSIAGRG